jgi:hypothetical protein
MNQKFPDALLRPCGRAMGIWLLQIPRGSAAGSFILCLPKQKNPLEHGFFVMLATSLVDREPVQNLTAQKKDS